MFVRIGHRFINLARVVSVHVDGDPHAIDESTEPPTIGFLTDRVDLVFAGAADLPLYDDEARELVAILDRYAAMASAQLAAMESLRPDGEGAEWRALGLAKLEEESG